MREKEWEAEGSVEPQKSVIENLHFWNHRRDREVHEDNKPIKTISTHYHHHCTFDDGMMAMVYERDGWKGMRRDTKSSSIPVQTKRITNKYKKIVHLFHFSLFKRDDGPGYIPANPNRNTTLTTIAYHISSIGIRQHHRASLR